MFIRIYPPPGSRIPQTFEGFYDHLQTWDGMYIEQDGSFVWAIRRHNTKHQIDGMVYDRDGAIEYLELKGIGHATEWRMLCEVLCSRDHHESTDDESITVDDSLPSKKETAIPDAWNFGLRVHDVESGRWLTPFECFGHLQDI